MSGDKSEKEKALEAFKYFENANTRNRESFIELLDYTIRSKRDSETTDNTEDTESK
ncbi:MAG: hypothetical protein VB106_04500 [Clostridiaceae bacterium]|jgi:hypothetical protein|nr:hypothetical protein [Clostridiaceae bacterium]